VNMEMTTLQIGEKEAEEIISEIYDCSGYDFFNYSSPSLIRRFQRYIDLKKITSLNELFELVNSDSAILNEFIEEITVNVTEMFRDPYFFKIIREKVLPELKNNSPLKIWHAGCSTGEEVYSMAIVLKEQGVLDNCIIYATDINQSVLEHARRGVYSLDNLKQYEQNYKESEAKGNFKDYYEIKNGEAVMDPSLREKIIFSSHNLVSDRGFNKFDLIVCRNVLIYFNKELQSEVLQTFYDSLNPKGFLALGSKESLLFTSIFNSMDEFHRQFKIWRKRE
jgi:chemotaxis protein methyltransferase CheR